MKWIGIAAALLSFATAVYAVVHSEAELRERQRVVAEQLSVGHAQEVAGDYPAAWDTLGKASATAEVDGIFAKLLGDLSKERRTVRAAQENVAMEWLRVADAPEGHKFAEIADKLIAVLTSGANSATAERKGDLLAHLGWAYFLKDRDGERGIRPEVSYKEAVTADANNPYANVFWGHWILWNHGSLNEATTRFAAALTSGRARPIVREFQLAALGDLHTPEADAAWFQAVNEMRKANEPIDAAIQSDLYNRYYFSMHDEAEVRRMLAAVPAADHAELQQMLLKSNDLGADRKETIGNAMQVMAKVAATPAAVPKEPGSKGPGSKDPKKGHR